MVNPYNKKPQSRRTKTPTGSSQINIRGDKVASGIVKAILLAKIRRIDQRLINMIKNSLYRELAKQEIKYKSTYDLFIWCLYYLEVMEHPHTIDIVHHLIRQIQVRLQEGQTHKNQKFRNSKILQFKRYLSSLSELKNGLDKQSVRRAISIIFGTKQSLGITRIKLIESFDWSICGRSINQTVYIKPNFDDMSVSKEMDNQSLIQFQKKQNQLSLAEKIKNQSIKESFQENKESYIFQLESMFETDRNEVDFMKEKQQQQEIKQENKYKDNNQRQFEQFINQKCSQQSLIFEYNSSRDIQQYFSFDQET